MSFLLNLLNKQSDRFYRSRLADNEAELEDIDQKVAELLERRRVVQEAAEFCRARLGLDD